MTATLRETTAAGKGSTATGSLRTALLLSLFAAQSLDFGTGGLAPDLRSGTRLALEVLASGAALEKLEELRAFR